jgi:hypothetical protein
MEEVEAVVGGHLLYISYVLTNEESHAISMVGKRSSDLKVVIVTEKCVTFILS